MTTWIENFRPKLEKKYFLRLFLVTAFFPHIWALINGMRVIDQISYDFNMWYFLRYFGYVLGFALLETALYFGIVLVFTLLLPRRWSGLQTFSLMGVWAFIMPISVIATKIYFNSPIAREWIAMEVAWHPRLTYFFLVLLWFIVITAFGLPAILIARSEKAADKFAGLLDRIVILSWFYLALDLIGFLAILGRLIIV